MKKKYWEYLVILAIFILFLFQDSIDNIFIKFNKLDYQTTENTEIENLKKEVNSLKEVIDLKESLTNDYVVSKVKARDIYEFSDTLTIYKGTKDGLKEEMSVINENGLVGIIKKCLPHSSIVELITNKNRKISVRINNTYGILESTSDGLIVSDITNYEEIKVKDKIYTSGIGNLPGNLYIGEVEDINLNDLGIEQIIKVKSPIDFNNLGYLLVVVPS